MKNIRRIIRRHPEVLYSADEDVGFLIVVSDAVVPEALGVKS